MMSCWPQSMSKLHHFMSWINPVICLWILYVMILFNPVMCYMHIILCFVVYNYVQMTFHISICFCHAQLYMNDRFIPNSFPIRFCKMGIFSCFLASFAGINRWGRSPWCISSQWWVIRRLLSLIFRFHHLRDALQRVNSVVWLTGNNCYSNA